MKRPMSGLVFILWLGFILSAFYVVQKPFLMGVLSGLTETLWAVVVWLLVVTCGLAIGEYLSSKLIRVSLDPVERVILGAGVGLGILGFVGFFLGLFGWTSPAWLIGLLLGLCLLLRKMFPIVHKNILETYLFVSREIIAWPLLLKASLIGTFLFAFLLALSPPADGFDALSYHLVGPEKIIRDGGVLPYDHLQLWFPGLPEGLFLFAIGMKAIRATQLLHLTWAIFSILLIWYWASKVWNGEVARTTILIILSMPSLYLLASWAYSDFTLAFFGIASLYSVYKGHEEGSKNSQNRWLIFSGIAAGMAMGVKYTSFVIPLTLLILIFIWNIKSLFVAINHSLTVGIYAILVASPWFIRNWIVVKNPFYPFIFGGLYWDEFRSAWLANSGTGVGWNINELLLLPLNAVLGHRDANYYDGRIGPLFLVLAPLAIFAILRIIRCGQKQMNTVLALTIFSFISFAMWTIGVVRSSSLWQTRLLYPALIAFSLPTALGLLEIKTLDSPKLKVSFVSNVLFLGVITINLIDAGLFVVKQNPLPTIAGIVSTNEYLRSVEPAYAEAVDMLNQTSDDANIYMLFEPRSYYITRKVQPDLILDNLAHDNYIFGSPNRVITAWRSQGYTHVLVYRLGFDFLSEKFPLRYPIELKTLLQELTHKYLRQVSLTEDGIYELYEIIK